MCDPYSKYSKPLNTKLNSNQPRTVTTDFRPAFGMASKETLKDLIFVKLITYLKLAFEWCKQNPKIVSTISLILFIFINLSIAISTNSKELFPYSKSKNLNDFTFNYMSLS